MDYDTNITDQIMSLFDHPKSGPLTGPSIERLANYKFGAEPKEARAAVRQLVASGLLVKARGWDFDDGYLVGYWLYFWPAGRLLRARSGRPERPALHDKGAEGVSDA